MVDLSNTHPVPVGIKRVGLTAIILLVGFAVQFYRDHEKNVAREAVKSQVDRIAADLRRAGVKREADFQRIAQQIQETDLWKTKIEIRNEPSIRLPSGRFQNPFGDYQSVVRSAGPDRHLQTDDDVWTFGPSFRKESPLLLQHPGFLRPGSILGPKKKPNTAPTEFPAPAKTPQSLPPGP